jgi:hypothetical protein
MTGTLPAVLEPMAREAEERFLDLVASTGNSSAAARAVGFHRNTFYKRAASDEDFRRRWDAAQGLSRRSIAEEVLDKAMVATGRVVEEPLLDAQGNPVLDDDLEPVTVRRLIDGDARILAKMLDKFVHSEDGPPTIGVQVNNMLPPAAPPAPRVARLVFSDEPAIDAAPSAAEVAVEASWEDLG